MTTTTAAYDAWMKEVDGALKSIGMARDDWQGIWAFDFHAEFAGRRSANDAAARANRFWWKRQNEALNQQCRKSADCWLPQDHRGECEPV